jgi:integrase
MSRPKSEGTKYRLVRVRDKRYPDGFRPAWHISWTSCTSPQSTGTEDKEEAGRYLEEFKAQQQTPDLNVLIINKIIDLYLEYKKAKYDERNASDSSNYRDMKSHLGRPREFFGNLHAEHVTRRLGREYEIWRRKVHEQKYKKVKGDKYKPLSNATIRRELGLLIAALNYAYDEKWIKERVSIELPPAPTPKERIATDKEKRQFMEKCDTFHIKLFFVLALTTAQRKSAICELKWEQVDFKKRLIDFNPPGRFKTRKRRAVLKINDLLMSYLQEARKIAETENVIEFNAKPVKKIDMAFRRTMQRAKLEGISPHILRHTALSDMAAKGVPMEKLAAISGDSIETVHKHYLKFAPDYLDDAVDVLNYDLG